MGIHPKSPKVHFNPTTVEIPQNGHHPDFPPTMRSVSLLVKEYESIGILKQQATIRSGCILGLHARDIPVNKPISHAWWLQLPAIP